MGSPPRLPGTSPRWRAEQGGGCRSKSQAPSLGGRGTHDQVEGKAMWNPKTEENLKERRESAPAKRHQRSKVRPHRRQVHSPGVGGKKVVQFRETSFLLLPFLLHYLRVSLQGGTCSSPENAPYEASHFSNSPCPQSTFSYLQLNDYVLNPHLSCQTTSSPRAWAPSARLTVVSPGLAWGLAWSGA